MSISKNRISILFVMTSDSYFRSLVMTDLEQFHRWTGVWCEESAGWNWLVIPDGGCPKDGSNSDAHSWQIRDRSTPRPRGCLRRRDLPTISLFGYFVLFIKFPYDIKKDMELRDARCKCKKQGFNFVCCRACLRSFLLIETLLSNTVTLALCVFS